MNASTIMDEFKRHNELSRASVQTILENNPLKLELLSVAREQTTRVFALSLLQWFIRLRKEEQGVGSDDLVFAAVLIGQHGHVEDCLRIWEAKQCDFDTYCGLDIQAMMFAGVERTIAFLKDQKDEQGKRAMRYVIECREAGDFDHLDTYLQEHKRYWMPLSPEA